MPQPMDHGHPIDPDRFCTALTKRGAQCKNHALLDRQFCAYHGGEAEARTNERVEALSGARLPASPLYGKPIDVWAKLVVERDKVANLSDALPWGKQFMTVDVYLKEAFALSPYDPSDGVAEALALAAEALEKLRAMPLD